MEDEQGIMYKLGAIEAYLKSIDDKLNKSIDDTTKKLEDHSTKINNLEKGQLKIYTIATTLGGVGAFLVNIVMKAWGG